MTHEMKLAGLPARVHRLRMELDLSRAELARRCEAGVSASYVGRLERGDFNNPGSAAVIALAKALETTPTYLLTGEDENSAAHRMMLTLGFTCALLVAIAGALGASLGTYQHAVNGGGFALDCKEPVGLLTHGCVLLPQ